MLKKICFVLGLLVSVEISVAQIKINEYSVSNATVGVAGPTFIDNQGNTLDVIPVLASDIALPKPHAVVNYRDYASVA